MATDFLRFVGRDPSRHVPAATSKRLPDCPAGARRQQLCSTFSPRRLAASRRDCKRKAGVIARFVAIANISLLLVLQRSARIFATRCLLTEFRALWGVSMGAMAYDIVPPDPASMIESLSALGYTLGSAISDLVNNSIDTGAGTIDLDFHRNDLASYISVADGDKGMTEAEVQTAMAIAARGPRTSWSGAELGRFGMGLKTASFSQTSRLSVWTRSAKNKQPSIRGWDQERVVNSSEWQLLQSRRGREEDPCTGVGVPVRSRHGRVVTRVVCSTYCKDGSCRR